MRPPAGGRAGPRGAPRQAATGDAPRQGAAAAGAPRNSGVPRRGPAEASRPELGAQLAASVDGLGLALAAPARELLLDYLDLIVRWNRSFNLTAIRDPRAMVAAHLADSLSLVPLLATLPAGALLVDVGSGAGLPGIPVGIARTDLRVDLVEPVGKKAAFLRQCRAELGLENLRVHEARIEQLSLEAEPAVITSRAFASLADFAESVASIAGAGTRLLAMKGARPDAEIDELADRALPWAVIAVETLDVPGLDAQRCVVVLEPRPISPAPNPAEP